MAIRGHHLILVATILFPLTMTITFTLAVAFNHVYPIMPFMSYTGDLPIESCFFSLGLNLLAVLYTFISFIRFNQVIKFCETESPPHASSILRMNQVSIVWALVSAFGLSVTGSFQELYAATLHRLGALVCTYCAFIYFWYQTVISDVVVGKLNSRRISLIRTILSFASTTIHIIAPVLVFILDTTYPRCHEETLTWSKEEEGWHLHVCCSFLEWCIFFINVTYIATFYEEFKRIIIKSNEIIFERCNPSGRSEPSGKYSGRSSGKYSGRSEIKSEEKYDGSDRRTPERKKSFCPRRSDSSKKLETFDSTLPPKRTEPKEYPRGNEYYNAQDPTRRSPYKSPESSDRYDLPKRQESPSQNSSPRRSIFYRNPDTNDKYNNSKENQPPKREESRLRSFFRRGSESPDEESVKRPPRSATPERYDYSREADSGKRTPRSENSERYSHPRDYDSGKRTPRSEYSQRTDYSTPTRETEYAKKPPRNVPPEKYEPLRDYESGKRTPRSEYSERYESPKDYDSGRTPRNAQLEAYDSPKENEYVKKPPRYATPERYEPPRDYESNKRSPRSAPPERYDYPRENDPGRRTPKNEHSERYERPRDYESGRSSRNPTADKYDYSPEHERQARNQKPGAPEAYDRSRENDQDKRSYKSPPPDRYNYPRESESVKKPPRSPTPESQDYPKENEMNEYPKRSFFRKKEDSSRNLPTLENPNEPEPNKTPRRSLFKKRQDSPPIVSPPEIAFPIENIKSKNIHLEGYERQKEFEKPLSSERTVKKNQETPESHPSPNRTESLKGAGSNKIEAQKVQNATEQAETSYRGRRKYDRIQNSDETEQSNEPLGRKSFLKGKRKKKDKIKRE